VGLLEISPRYVVSASADNTLRIWSPTTGACLATLTGHQASITCFHHDPHLNRIVSGSDGGIKLWDLSTTESGIHVSETYSRHGLGPMESQPNNGLFVRDLVTSATCAWKVGMDERRLVTAIQREGGRTWFEVFDFGENVVHGSRVEGPGDVENVDRAAFNLLPSIQADLEGLKV
jgi:F-box and WD-40 domain protein CDC4